LKALFENHEYGKSPIHFLQARLDNLDVIHFQSDTSYLEWTVFRLFVIVAAVATAVAYVCQYSIIRTSSGSEATIWIVCQAALAITKAGLWISKAKLNSNDASQAEHAIINTTAIKPITLAEIICASDPGETQIPRWVWDYLKTCDIQDLFKTALRQGNLETVPIDAPYFIFFQTALDDILDKRCGLDIQNEVENKRHKGRHVWRFGFWLDKLHKVHPFVLINVPYSKGDAWMIPDRSIVQTDNGIWYIAKLCSVFVLSRDGERLHLRSFKTPRKCDENCIHTSFKGFTDLPESYRYMVDRAKS
jgi:hypothetical protein